MYCDAPEAKFGLSMDNLIRKNRKRNEDLGERSNVTLKIRSIEDVMSHIWISGDIELNVLFVIKGWKQAVCFLLI